MGRFWRALLGYPVVLATVVTGLVGGALELASQPLAARVVVSAFAVVVAAMQARGMVEDLRAGTYGIDLLAVTAIGSTVAVGEHWAALVVCLMLSGGEALEDYAASRARRDLTSLLENAPRTAHRLGDDGAETDVPVEEVAVGDRVVVRPFELVPVDGVLVSATASLDESSLTGEPLPVAVERGGQVLSGAVNGSAAIEIEATAAAADSQYQRIVALAAEAQESKAPFVRLADRVAVPFTVVSLGIAATAWALSGDPSRFAEVLVVATPCPLIIAAPVAFLGGMSRSSRGGIIVKHSGALERLARARTAAFDKTGTLTYGEPRVAAVRPSSGSADELLALAAAVEQHSNHPLARAIVERAADDGVQVPEAHDVTEVPAHGVRATVEGRNVVVGSARFVAAASGGGGGEGDGAEGDGAGGDGAEGERAEGDDVAGGGGASFVYVGVEGRYAGHIALTDAPRPEARATVATLRRAGLRAVMVLTGDGEAAARSVAGTVGIDDVRASLLPQDKVAAVQDAPQRPVLMVGDGVNDAPVLAAADVGIAMGARGSSAASESADVVVLVDDLARVARAVLVSQRTMRIAWQAITIGVAMSVGLMLVAAFGYLPAIVGAWLQEVVDLACIGWALLALRAGRGERRELARLAAERDAEGLVAEGAGAFGVAVP